MTTIPDQCDRSTLLNWHEGVNYIYDNLFTTGNQEEKLKIICDGIVETFHADFCRIWLIRPGDRCDTDCTNANSTDSRHLCKNHDQCLHLVASSGRYTHCDGAHARVPYGCYKIGRIASGEEASFLTNDAANDSRIHNHNWVRELDLVAFAGHQLRDYLGNVNGVLAFFSKEKVSPEAHAIIRNLANSAAQVIQSDNHIVELTREKKAHQKSQAEFHAIFNAITDAVVFVNKQRQIVMINPAFTSVFGYELGELAGKTTQLLYANPDEFHNQGKKRYNPKGTLSVNPIYQVDYRRKDGSIFSSETLGVPVKEPGGEIIGFVGVIRDTTERMRAENEKLELEKQLSHTYKMEAIGTLAGGIAHDFNNILAAIIGYSEFVQEAVPADSPIGMDIDKVLVSAKRATELVKQILTFSRKTDSAKQDVYPHLLVSEALKMLKATLPTSITLETDLDPNCGMILANPTNIHQIIVNLCTNALHAIPDNKGVLSVSLQSKKCNVAESIGKIILPPGDFVALTVHDSGHGMDKTTMNRIFEPYFSTKELGDGTGLGLALVHGIVLECNGFIDVESSVGEGSTFKIFFPAVKKSTSQAVVSVSKDKATKATGNERILVVDDEPLLVKINEKRLQALGYKVTGVTDSNEALSIFRSQPDNFDLLITDQTMPGLTGDELAEAMLAIKPSLPVILCTGHSETFSKEEALSMGIKKYVFKPLHGDELLEAVQEIFAEK